MALSFALKQSGNLDETVISGLRLVAGQMNDLVAIDPTEISGTDDKFTGFRDATMEVDDDGVISIDTPNDNGVFEDKEYYISALRDAMSGQASVQDVHLAMYFLGDSHITDTTTVYKIEDSATPGTYVATPIVKSWVPGSALA